MTTHRLTDLRTKHRVRAGLTALAMAGGLALFTRGAAAVPQDELGVLETKSALELLLETNGVISREKRDWALAKEFLEERIALRRREITSLEEGIAQDRDSIRAEEESLEGLVQQEEELSATEAALAERVTKLEERTRAFLARSPAFFQQIITYRIYI